jgi:uncharacterized membrane protein
MGTVNMQFLKSSAGKLLIIEVIIFGVVGLVALLTQANYGVALIVAGAGIWFVNFTTASGAPRLSRGAFSHGLEQQFLDDFKDTGAMKKRFEFINDILLIGAIPLIAGMILSLLRL